jgi:hypothetical protein
MRNGAFLPEYALVRAGPDRAVRRADAVIFPDEPHGRVKAHDYPSLAGRNVIVVPTKPGRMGMHLMGASTICGSSCEGSGRNRCSLHIAVPQTSE